MGAAVGMKNAAGNEDVVAGRHRHRVGDQAGPHVVGHGVADDFPVEAVDDGGQVKPALPGRDVGDVADELGAGPVGGEVRSTRSGIGAGLASAIVVVLYGRGWQATSPSSRISRRTSSSPTCSPPRSSSAWIRR